MIRALLLTAALASCAHAQKAPGRCPSTAAYAADFVAAGVALTGSVAVINDHDPGETEGQRVLPAALLAAVAMGIAYSASVAGDGCP